MMAGFLVAGVHLPFPARNGVTLPPASLSTALRARGHRVEVAWLDAPEVPQEGVEETRAAVDRIQRVPLRTRPFPSRVLGQLLVGRPAFDRWDLASDPVWDGPAPDLIWATPRNCLSAALQLRAAAGWAGVPLVAAVNDIWTGVVRERRQRGPTAWSPHLGLSRAEARLLAESDRVVVQSATDARVAREELGLDRDQVVVLPNGVSDELFGLPLHREAEACGWVGDTSTQHYRWTTRRLLEEVWPRIRADHPDLRLLAAGPGSRDLDAPEAGILGRGFVAELADVYQPLRLLLAPVFKGHGRINKVAEAMAAGVPVVGDPTAFHDLPGFEPGVHGVVAEGWDDLAEVASRLLNDEPRRMAVAREARRLASEHFRWDDRVDTVERWLTGGA